MKRREFIKGAIASLVAAPVMAEAVDGVALLSTASGGTYSDRLAVDADLSEAAIEDGFIPKISLPRYRPSAMQCCSPRFN